MKVSFVTPMKEKDFRVIRMLKSIRSQNYPQDKIEIVIVDGGSNPEVLKECKKYNVKLYEEESSQQGAEGAGRAKDQAIWKSTGDLIVISESDVEYIGNEWINNMIKPFKENPDIFATVPKLFLHPKDNATNRYLSYVGVDPFASYRALEGHLEFNRKLRGKKFDGYTVFSMDKNEPYCMGSNGFMFKRELIDKVGDYAQDVEFVGRLAKHGYLKFAYVENAPVWHKNINSLLEFIRKRIKWTLDYPKKYAGEKKDFQWVTNKTEFIKYVAKNLLFIPNVPISIKKAVEYNDSSWLLHAPLIWYSTALNVYVALSSNKMLKQAFPD